MWIRKKKRKNIANRNSALNISQTTLLLATPYTKTPLELPVPVREKILLVCCIRMGDMMGGTKPPMSEATIKIVQSFRVFRPEVGASAGFLSAENTGIFNIRSATGTTMARIAKKPSAEKAIRTI